MGETVNPDDLPPGFEVASDVPAGFEVTSTPPKKTGREAFRSADPETRLKVMRETGREQGRIMFAKKTGKDGKEGFFDGVSRRSRAAIWGMGEGGFGLGPLIARSQIAGNIGEDLSDAEKTAFMEGMRESSFENAPVSTIAGGIGTGLAGGGVVNAGVRGTTNATAQVVGRAAPAAAPVANNVANAVNSTLQLNQGQRGLNAAKLATTGLAATTATTAIGDGRLPTTGEAVVGTVAGPALAGLGVGGKMILDRAASQFGIDAAALRLMANKIGINIDERAVQRANDTGDAPMLGELLTPQEQQEIAKTIAKAPESANVMEAGVNSAEQRFRTGVVNDMSQIGPMRGPNQIEMSRDDAIRATMDQLRPETVSLTPQMVRALRENGALRGLTPAETRAVTSGNVTVDFMDNLRQGLPDDMRTAKSLIEDMVTTQHPTYGPAIRDFSAQSSRAEAARAGASGIMSDMTTPEFMASRPRPYLPLDQQAAAQGFPEGTVERLTGAAIAAPDRVANQIMNGGVGDKIAALLGTRAPADRAARSVAARSAGRDSARGVAGLKAATQADLDARATGDAVTGALTAFMPFGGAAKAALAQRAAMGLAIPQRVRVRVAEMLLDPERAVDAVALLNAQGIRNQEIRDMYQGMAAMAGSMAADGQDAPAE